MHLVGYFHSCITMHGFMKVKSSKYFLGELQDSINATGIYSNDLAINGKR